MDEPDPTQPCEICDRLIHTHMGPRKLDVQKMIHSSFRCRPCIRSTKLKKDLCKLCKHMGLRHLLICCRHLFEEAWNSGPDSKLTLDLRLGSWDELRSRTKCSLCELIARCSLRLSTVTRSLLPARGPWEVFLRIENEKTDATVQHQLRFGCRRLYDLYDTDIGRIRYSLMPFSPKENQWRKLLPWVDTCSPGSKRVAVASTTSSIRKFID